LDRYRGFASLLSKLWHSGIRVPES